MSNEKMRILKMLEDRKITAEEAERLLQVVNSTPSGGSQTEKTSKGESLGLDDFTENLTKKIEVLAKDFEPTIKGLTSKLVTATAKATDKLSQTFSEHMSGSGAGKASGGSTSTEVGTKRFEIKVTEENSELNLTGVNGQVRVKGYNGDKITLNVDYKVKRKDASIELIKLGNKYLLHYNESDFDTVSIEGYVPESMFSKIKINNSNKEVNICKISCNEISIESSNATMELEDIKANVGNFENVNGKVNSVNIDIAKLKLSTFNNSIRICNESFMKFQNYFWDIETSNNSLDLTLPTNVAYYIKAETSLGDIKVGLTDMNFLSSTTSSVEAKSINYDSKPNKVKMKLETSNGLITIN